MLDGIDLLEQIADGRRGGWTAAQQARSDERSEWLDEAKYGPKFFRWFAKNPQLLTHVERVGTEAAKSGRVSMGLIYQQLRSAGAAGVAPKTSGAYKFHATLEAPLGWAFGFAYPDIEEAWDLKPDGPRAKRPRSGAKRSDAAAPPAARYIDRKTGREVPELRTPEGEEVIVEVGHRISLKRKGRAVMFRVHSIEDDDETVLVHLDPI